jgi:hypothetical protein
MSAARWRSWVNGTSVKHTEGNFFSEHFRKSKLIEFLVEKTISTPSLNPLVFEHRQEIVFGSASIEIPG